MREDDFYDPLLAGEKVNTSGNYNTVEGREEWAKKKDKKKQKDDLMAQDALDKKINEFMATKAKVPAPRVIHDKSKNSKADIFLPKVTLVAGGKALLDGATLRLTRGRKYGLVGRNGIGKTTLINAMCRRELDKMPMNLHILQVEQEVIGDDVTVLQHVINCDEERISLLNEQEELTNKDTTELEDEEKDEHIDRLKYVTERLELIGADEVEHKATQILVGLGFQNSELNNQSKKFSGGWRMRIAIAKVIFSEPEILLLDEPTNHLDLVALIWLENYVKQLDITVLIVSHARDFLNQVVDEIIDFQDKKLDYYRGDFNTFEKTKNEKLKQLKRQRESQLSEINHMQKFVDKFRFNAKRATMAQSRIKAIAKIDLVDEVMMDPSCVFIFPNPEKISPPILRLDEAVIGWSQDKPLLSKVNINVDMETRIAMVGPNGAGKSTLVKTLIG